MKFEEVIKTCTQLVSYNNHTQAYIVGCTFLGLYNAVKQLESIKKSSKEAGYLSSDASNHRYQLYQLMIVTAKERLPEADYKRFYNCF